MAAVKDMHVPLLRWPGGNFSSNYHWTDGIGPRDRRPARLEMAWGTVENNRFGTHEFMDYVEAVGAEPYICLNLGTGTWSEAQQWIEYVNGTAETAIVQERRKNGRAEPWKVKYWALGNEMDGYWQMGHRSAADYGAFALETAKLAKLTDPDVKLIAAGASNFRAGSDWISWNRTVLDYLKDYADYISMHMYVGNPGDDYADFVASPMRWTSASTRLRASSMRRWRAGSIMRPASRRRTATRSISRSTNGMCGTAPAATAQRGRRILEERYNLEDALVVAGFLNLAGQPCRCGEDCQPGAAGQCDRADLHRREGALPADDLLSAAAFRR